MLSKKNRLYREKDINKTLKDGKTFFLPEFIIIYYYSSTVCITSTSVSEYGMHIFYRAGIHSYAYNQLIVGPSNITLHYIT